MTALPLTLKEMRAPDRAQRWACLVPSFCRRLLALGMLAALVAGGSIAAHAAEPVKGEIRVVTDGGYARLVFRFEEAIDAKVRVSGAIVVIEFKQPVAVAVDRINAGARDYISAARSDPDGMAIRIALARKLIVNSIPPPNAYMSICCPSRGMGCGRACRRKWSTNWRRARARPKRS